MTAKERAGAAGTRPAFSGLFETSAGAQAESSRLNAVSLAKQRKGMGFLGMRRGSALSYALHDMPPRDRAIGGNIVWTCAVRPFAHLPEDRAADLHRAGEELLLHAPGAVVARAALDRVDGRAR